MSSKGQSVERRCALDPDRFAEEFLSGVGRPVVVTDALDGFPARERWSFDYFASRFGDEIVTATYPDPRDAKVAVRMRLRDYVDYLRSPDQPPAGEIVRGDLEALDGRLYLATWTPISRLAEDFSPHPYFAEDYTRLLTGAMKERLNGWVILGPEGAFSRLHCDALNTHAYLGQFHGTKRCILLSPEDTPYVYDGAVDVSAPDLDRHPLYERASPFECILEPGEVLFLPPNWWHYAVCLEPSITVSFNFFNRTNFGAYFEALGHLPFLCAGR